MSSSTLSMHHVAILVRSLARAEQFYGEVLGLEIRKRWYADDGKTARSIWFSLGEHAFLAVELAPEDCLSRAAEPDTVGLHLLSLGITKNAREHFRTRLAQAGHAVTHETRYTLYCRDPEGNRVGLSHWPDPVDEASS